MFVTIGWFSFFFIFRAPDRVAMSIIGFVANTNFLAAQLNQLPRLGNEVLLLRFLYLSTIFSFYSRVGIRGLQLFAPHRSPRRRTS